MSGSREDVFENNPSVCTCNSTTYEWSCDCAGFTTKTLDGQRCELANFVEAYVECEYPDPEHTNYSGCDENFGYPSTEGNDWLCVSTDNVFGACGPMTRGATFDLKVKIAFDTGSECGALSMQCDENIDGRASGRCRIPSGTGANHKILIKNQEKKNVAGGGPTFTFTYEISNYTLTYVLCFSLQRIFRCQKSSKKDFTELSL